MSEGSLAAASDILNLSQPAVSRLISGLEGELHLELFHRTRRRLVPTPEGIEFYREAGRILDNLDEIPRIVAEIKSHQTQKLRVVTMPRTANALVAPVIGKFISETSNFKVSVDVRTRRDAESWLVGNEYDLGIGALPASHPEIETEILIRARAQLVLPSEHKLSTRAEVRAEDIKDEPVIGLMKGLLLRNQIDDLFSAAGIEKAYSCETSASQLACQMVMHGAGVTIADSLTIAPLTSNELVLVPIVPERWIPFGLLWQRNKDMPESAKILIEYLRRETDRLIEADANLKK